MFFLTGLVILWCIYWLTDILCFLWINTDIYSLWILTHLQSNIHVHCPYMFSSVIWADTDHQIFVSHARRGFWVNANDFLPGCRWTHFSVQKLYGFYVQHNENGAAFENMNLFSEAFEAQGTNKREAIMSHSRSQYCSAVSINEDGVRCIFFPSSTEETYMISLQ